MKDLFDSEQNEDPQNYNFGHGDDILNSSGQCSTPHVDKNEYNANCYRHGQRRRLMATYGATFELTPREGGMPAAIERAEALAERERALQSAAGADMEARIEQLRADHAQALAAREEELRAAASEELQALQRRLQAREAEHLAGREAELAVIVAPAKVVPDIISDCGEAGVGAAIVISAGFSEAGPQGLALESNPKLSDVKMASNMVSPK